MKKLHIIYLAGIAVLVFLLYRNCNEERAPAVTQAQVDSLNNAHDSTNALLRDSVALLTIAINKNDSERIAQIQAKELLEKRMTDKIVSLTFSLNKYRAAKAGRDTVQQLINCDDIVQAFDSLYAEALLYKMQFDSVIVNSAGRRGIDSAAIALRDRTIVQLNSDYLAAMHFLQESLDENLDLRKSLARSKRGKWLVAGLAAVLGGFVGHSIK